jgi:pyrimidine operon attenuation protein / uracil phosphoribosyltransferase
MIATSTHPTLDQLEPTTLLAQLTKSISDFLLARGRNNPLIIGLHRGGVWVANALHCSLAESLKLDLQIGQLDISFYRDDFATAGLPSTAIGSQLPVDINGRHVLLVDDILYTGRTIRAAMNELFDYGRPASITLAVLIERDGRELPMQADCIGARIGLPTNQVLKLSQKHDGSLALILHERSVRQTRSVA